MGGRVTTEEYGSGLQQFSMHMRALRDQGFTQGKVFIDAVFEAYG